MRPTKNGYRETVQKGDATMTNPDGSIVTGSKNVTRAVEELIGIDRGQFTQIAMIAQGDFLKLLLATTKDRSEIFREIFNTRPYLVFKDRLSLALGLSDEIQSSAGDIRLDTMFVDEGFGSLDEDSIDQAMKAFYGLTDGSRLVGIILHVSELKLKIDKQIVVKIEKTGGSRISIIA